MLNVVPEKLWRYISANFVTKLLLAQRYDSILVVYDCLTKIVHFIATIKKYQQKSWQGCLETRYRSCIVYQIALCLIRDPSL